MEEKSVNGKEKEKIGWRKVVYKENKESDEIRTIRGDVVLGEEFVRITNGEGTLYLNPSHVIAIKKSGGGGK